MHKRGGIIMKPVKKSSVELETCSSGVVSMYGNVHVLTCMLMLAAMIALTGCGLFGSSSNGTAPLPKLNRIAILPMDRASAKVSERPTCNLSDSVIDTSNVPPEPAEALSSLIFDKYRNDPRFLVVPEGKCMGFLNNFLANNINQSQLSLIRSFGKQLGVDAVLYGKLYRYRERIGNNYSVQRPASVGFDLNLIRTRDGAVLWRFNFDKTQQALTENLFDFGFYRSSGMRWLTADELARYGMEKALADLDKRLEPAS